MIFGFLIILTLGVLYYFSSKSLPDYTGNFKVLGITNPVEIVRTEHNIPHIFGTSDSDVFFALGYVHAQDRLWQMTNLRRVAQGRLSEIYGNETIEIDELMRRFDLYDLASNSLPFQDQQTIEALEAYARGVNTHLNSVNSIWRGKGAPEFLLFRSPIHPWTPIDSLAILNLQAVRLASHLENEILGQRILSKLGPEKLKTILPDAYSPNLIPFGNSSTLEIDGGENEVQSEEDVDGLNIGEVLGFGGGSNAWVVSPEKTVNGKAILASDPHLGLSVPSIWYLARLELSNGGVIGASIPGVPAIIAGRSSHLAWGITFANIDDQDLYFEKLDPTNDNRYLTPTGFRNFRNRLSDIEVKGQALPTTIQLSWSENGPVIPKKFYNLKSIVPDGHVASLAWTLFEPQNTSLSAAIGLMKAATIDDGLQHMGKAHTPGLNFFISDGDNIAYQLVGKSPLRSSFHETEGRLPSAGWKYRNRWYGSIPYEDMPRIINPSTGYLANTNNKPVDQEYPHHLSFSWNDTKRYKRLNNILTTRPIHSKQSTIQTQIDIVSETARTLVPLFSRGMGHLIGANPADEQSALKIDALGLLNDWVGDMDQDKAQPLIYSQWLVSIFRLITQDELGTIYEDYSYPDADFLERVFRDIDGASSWCDFIQTERVEDCDTIASLALDDTLRALVTSYGEDISLWKWGAAHQINHDHTPLGSAPLMSWLNIRYPGSGSIDTLNRSSPSGEFPDIFSSDHGAGYRGVYDFSNLDESEFIIATGQSGHPLSQYYDDLSRHFAQNKYLRMSLNPDLARSNSIGTTTLQP